MAKNLEGKKCPKFSAECTSGLNLSNKDFEGKNFVIYFYPKDSTPGCTTEGQEFRDNYKYFKNLIQKSLVFLEIRSRAMKILSQNNHSHLSYYQILMKKSAMLLM